MPKRLDKIFLVVVFIILTWISAWRHGYGKTIDTILTSDPSGYYMYIPTVFIDEGIHHINRDFTGWVKNEKGEIYIKYTCGVALCYLPSFIVAHAYTHIFHQSTTGYGQPYCWALMIGALIWSFTGIALLKRLLLKYFSWTTTWLTLICIIFGTNYLTYCTLEVGMSHIYNFTLIIAALSVADEYFKYPTKTKMILLGLLLGWIILIRPTNIIFALFLVLYRVSDWQQLHQRAELLKRNVYHVLLAIPFSIAICIPQLLYWQAMTGRWISYSYANEKFIYWNHPKIIDVLFDTQNGWLLYSPVMLFMFWSLVMRKKDERISAWATWMIFAVITYLFASWWAWSFAGAFGHRCYIDYYPVFAFPLAVTIEAIFSTSKKYVKIPSLFFILIFCYYSVAFNETYMINGVYWEGEHWRWNWDGWLGIVKEKFGIPDPRRH